MQPFLSKKAAGKGILPFHRGFKVDSGMTREASVVIHCRGHTLVTANHPSTLEITRDNDLTLRGDCILGVSADLGARDLPGEIRTLLCNDDACIHTILSCDGMTVEIHARGSSAFTLDHPTDMVWRKSGYVCGRTVAIHADTAARSIPREFVKSLRKGNILTLVFRVMVED